MLMLRAQSSFNWPRSLVKTFTVQHNASDHTGPQPLLLRSGGAHEIQVATQYLVFLWNLALISTLESALYGREKNAPQSVAGLAIAT